MANHWANKATVLGYIHSVLVPYIVDTHTKLKLLQSSPALAIFDRAETNTNFTIQTV